MEYLNPNTLIIIRTVVLMGLSIQTLGKMAGTIPRRGAEHRSHRQNWRTPEVEDAVPIEDTYRAPRK
jgi:hypothetical protein